MHAERMKDEEVRELYGSCSVFITLKEFAESASEEKGTRNEGRGNMYVDLRYAMEERDHG